MEIFGMNGIGCKSAIDPPKSSTRRDDQSFVLSPMDAIVVIGSLHFGLELNEHLIPEFIHQYISQFQISQAIKN